MRDLCACLHNCLKRSTTSQGCRTGTNRKQEVDSSKYYGQSLLGTWSITTSASFPRNISITKDANCINDEMQTILITTDDRYHIIGTLLQVVSLTEILDIPRMVHCSKRKRNISKRKCLPLRFQRLLPIGLEDSPWSWYACTDRPLGLSNSEDLRRTVPNSIMSEFKSAEKHAGRPQLGVMLNKPKQQVAYS